MGKKWPLALLLVAVLIIGSNAYAQDLQGDSILLWTYPVSLDELHQDYIRLVNQDNLLPSDYVPENLTRIKVKKTSSSAIQMSQFVSDALDEMFAAALDDGVTLYAHSGYRSYQTQNTMYRNRLEKNNGKDDGVVAYPGSSDHQTGLGIDVISKSWIGKKLNGEFGKTKEAMWMAANCMNYGFIIRYPEGKEDITKIIYEPWHLRFVGIEAARYLMSSGLTLEEFTEEWQQALNNYEKSGGDADQAMIQSQLPPTPITLDIYGEDGDPEVTLFH